MIFSKYHALGNDYVVINPRDIEGEIKPDIGVLGIFRPKPGTRDIPAAIFTLSHNPRVARLSGAPYFLTRIENISFEQPTINDLQLL